MLALVNWRHPSFASLEDDLRISRLGDALLALPALAVMPCWGLTPECGRFTTNGRNWDMYDGRAREEEKVKGIKALGWFNRDLIYGDKVPALGE